MSRPQAERPGGRGGNERGLAALGRAGIVAVIRAESGEHAVAIGSALVDEGVLAIEITFTTPEGLSPETAADQVRQPARDAVTALAAARATTGAGS